MLLRKLKSIRRIYPYSSFKNNNLLIDAIVRNLGVIGEAAKNIPAEFRNKHNTIPWRKIAGMRDIVIHEYFNVDVEILWQTIQQDIPELKKLINTIKK